MLDVSYASVIPKDDNGTLAGFDLNVDRDESFIFTFGCFIRDDIGFELRAASPVNRDFNLGDSSAGSTDHQPPALSINYHSPTESPWKPFVGAGANHTGLQDVDVNIIGASLTL